MILVPVLLNLHSVHTLRQLEELLTERNEMRTEVETLQDHHTTLLDHVEDLEDAQKVS